mmetsp:Transcript_19204/g.53027  ORF Transcript_19204/g.53027 Transcript_19204/m.53027 type:complete len:326 (-) Transcript_19204:942-1919(-)
MRLFQPVPGQFDTPLGFRPQIPPEQVSKTWVKLYATAGLRLLTTEEQDGLLAAVQNLLIASPFIFEPRTRPSPDWVKISEGLDEAVDGWITANYILEVVAADDASDTYGALDLGGASIQFTCRTPFMLDATLRTGQRQTGEAVVQLAGEDLHLYAVSHLAYGLIQSRRRVDNLVFNGRAGGESQTEIVHPCLLNGTRALCHKSGPTTVDCKPGGQVVLGCCVAWAAVSPVLLPASRQAGGASGRRTSDRASAARKPRACRRVEDGAVISSSLYVPRPAMSHGSRTHGKGFSPNDGHLPRAATINPSRRRGPARLPRADLRSQRAL